jgi:hypothetical protein
MKALLPVPVFDAVAGHLRRWGRRAHRDWEANQAHEDSLTGAAETHAPLAVAGRAA